MGIDKGMHILINTCISFAPSILAASKNSFDNVEKNILNNNNEKTKEILKKLGYSNYYEHISFIKEKL